MKEFFCEDNGHKLLLSESANSLIISSEAGQVYEGNIEQGEIWDRVIFNGFGYIIYIQGNKEVIMITPDTGIDCFGIVGLYKEK